MKFEVGKTYWTRDHKNKAKVLDIDCNAPGIDAMAVRIFSDVDNTSWIVARRLDGQVISDEKTKYDLAEEVVEPLKLSITWWVNIFKYAPILPNEKPHLVFSSPYNTKESATKVGIESERYLETISFQMDYTEKL